MLRLTKTQPAALLAVILLTLPACGHRYLSPRSTNPLIEDRVKVGDRVTVKRLSVLTSRADRRTILIMGDGKICAEPSPDVAEAISSQTTATLAAKETEVAVGSSLQTALLQLTRRSQGLDFYRTGAFVNCMMYQTGVFNKENFADANSGEKMTAQERYYDAMANLLKVSRELTLAEIEKLPDIATAIAQVTNPIKPTFPTANSKSGMTETTETTETTKTTKTIEATPIPETPAKPAAPTPPTKPAPK